MKKLNIPQIEACVQCPYAAIAQISVDASIGYFQYCGCKYDHKSRSALEMLQAMSECAIEDMMTIPDWCPLPDADEASLEQEEANYTDDDVTKAELAAVKQEIANGDYSTLDEWLRDRFRCWGNSKSAPEFPPATPKHLRTGEI